jgi:hypothetical protein
MRRMLFRFAAGLALGAALVTGTPLALGCSLDNIPSISADGQLAHFNLQPPTTQAELAIWAKFVFAHAYRTNARVIFSEDRAEVANSLVPSAMLRPWRWDFGDGNHTTGWTVHHAYSRPGTWRISVDAYLPSTKKWYLFDQAEVTITGAASSGMKAASG